jgi:hypothetical protein
MFTESRRWTCESSEAHEDLVASQSRMVVTHVEWRGTCTEYATCRWFGGLGLKTIGGRFYGFGSQNLGGGFKEERIAHGGIEEFASRRS